MFWEKEGKLIYSYDGETVCIEAWGKDALRVRATKNRSFTGRDWALEAKDAHAGEHIKKIWQNKQKKYYL